MSQNFESFTVLLIARVVQAIGGGGILPIATAEFGTTFPKEKRGLALGLVGGVYGLANIFGASSGSAIIDIFGQHNWQFIFYVNVPITLFILIAGVVTLPNNKNTDVKKIDLLGITTLTLMVLSILYGLKNIDYFDFANTFLSTSVYPFLIVFIVLLPIFVVVEKKAEDPVIKISYFKSPRIVITLFIAFITGIIIMGMIFVPQFAENSLKIASGSGGYLVIILGIFAGLGAPLSGKLIDKYGAKEVLGIGFIASIAGSLFLILYAAAYPSLFAVIICLILLGTGIGFTMGTPINYMMLDNTKVEESNSALATVSLVRSIGTAIAPAIMIGFISHAGMSVQGNIMNLLPNQISVPPLPYAQELTEQFNQLKSNPAMAEKFQEIDIPDLTAMETMQFDMNSNSGNFQLPEEILEVLQSSDVTTITENTKMMADYMFTQMTPFIITKITGGIESGINGINDTISQMTDAIAAIPAIPSMQPQIDQMENAKSQMTDTVDKMTALRDAVPEAFEAAKENYLVKMDEMKDVIENEFQTTLNNGFKQVYATVAIVSLLAMIVLILYKEDKKETKVKNMLFSPANLYGMFPTYPSAHRYERQNNLAEPAINLPAGLRNDNCHNRIEQMRSRERECRIVLQCQLYHVEIVDSWWQFH